MNTTESTTAPPQAAEIGIARDPSGTGRVEWGVVGAAVAWVTALMLIEWPAPFRETFNVDARYRVDSAVFAYAGELLRNGGTPYVSYWDHKPPLIHLINAAGLSLSGGQVWGSWLVSLVMLLAAVVLGYLAMNRAFGRLGAMLGIGYFAIALVGVRAFNLTEPYTLPIAWAAALLLVRWRPGEDTRYLGLGFMLGVLASLQFLFRPNLIGASVSVGLVFSIVLLSGRRIGGWFRFVGGGISGLGVVGAALIGWLAWEGAVQPFWEQVFHYNFLYSSTPWKARIRSGFDGIQAATWYGPLLLPFPGWLFAAYKLRASGRRDPLYPVFLLSVIWLPVELLLASASGRSFTHYFVPLLPPLAFLSALFTSALVSALVPSSRERWSEMRMMWARRTIVAVLGGMAIAAAWGILDEQRQNRSSETRPTQISSAVDYVRAHTGADESILVWGHATDIYFFADRRPASRFIYASPLLTPGYADAALVRGFLDELRVTKPELIIDATSDLAPSLRRWDPEWRHPEGGQVVWWNTTPALREFYDFVSENYALADSVGPQKWAMYRRSTSSARHGAHSDAHVAAAALHPAHAH